MKRGSGVRTRSAVATCAMLGFALCSTPDASAATIAVTTDQDAVAADGLCSLREAVTAANADGPPVAGDGECAAGSGAETIVLPAGTFKLNIFGLDDTNAGGDLDILGTELTIAGAGASATTIDANAIFDRAIDVRVGRIATVRNVTITGGRAPGGFPGDSRTGSSGQSATGENADPGESGGGIRNLGTLTVVESTISGNTAGAGGTGGSGTGGNASAFPGSGTGGAGGEGGAGGGIFNAGVLTVIRSLVSGNTAGAGGTGGFAQGGSATGSNGMGGLGLGGPGGFGGDGGGIAADSGATTTIQDSSITGNTAGRGGDGGLAQGGNGGPAGFMSGANGGTGGQGSGVAGGLGGGGGGIYTAGSLVVTGSLVEANAAGRGGDGGNAQGSVGGPALGTGNGGNGGAGNGGAGWIGGGGGGILATSMTLVATTVTGNRAGQGGIGGNGTGGQGGGALNGSGGNGGGGQAGDGGHAGSGGGVTTDGASTIRQATITSNELSAPGGPGTGTGGLPGNGPSGPGSMGASASAPAGIAGSGGATIGFGVGNTLTNSIVAANTAPSCAGVVQDGGHDIVFPDAGCPGSNVDPMLGTLADNGGPTKTQAIGPGSPALDAVPSAGAECAGSDQRGVSRPQGAGCDAGAYEWAPPGVATGQAIATSSNGATLQGLVNPNARVTTYHFELGTTTGYGRSTPEQSTGAGTAALAVEASVDGLEPGVTYHYRLVAANADGPAAGEDRTFVIPTPDTEAPRFLSASLAPRVFAVNRRGRSETPVTSRTRRGTTFRYTLSEAARVLFTIRRARPGRRVGRRCVKPTPRNRGRRSCTRFVLVRRFAAQATAGSNRKRFSGKIGRRALAPGTYRAVLTATDAAGNVSAPRRLRFRVVRAR